MTRRSPTNNRYQKGTKPKGVTRKSAASAKPKRAPGRHSKTPPKKKSWRERLAAGPGSKDSILRAMPDTPEYKKYR